MWRGENSHGLTGENRREKKKPVQYHSTIFGVCEWKRNGRLLKRCDYGLRRSKELLSLPTSGVVRRFIYIFQSTARRAQCLLGGRSVANTCREAISFLRRRPRYQRRNVTRPDFFFLPIWDFAHARNVWNIIINERVCHRWWV